MLTNSDRSRAQVRIEELLGYGLKPKEFQFKPAKDEFLNFKLPLSEVSTFEDKLLKDGRDLFFKGSLSFYQGIFDLHHGLHSWSMVKFYYSIFYFLKASLAMRGIAVIRCKSLFTLKSKKHAIPIKVTGRGDHKTIIKIWRELVTEVDDILLANTVDEVETYTWMMDVREIIQYRRKGYMEPKVDSFLTDVPLDNLDKQFQLYAAEPNSLFSFNPEHACLAIPLKRFLLSYEDLMQKNMDLTSHEKMVLLSLVRPYFNSRSVIIKPLIN